jgi:hypothetical protein
VCGVAIPVVPQRGCGRLVGAEEGELRRSRCRCGLFFRRAVRGPQPGGQGLGTHGGVVAHLRRRHATPSACRGMVGYELLLGATVEISHTRAEIRTSELLRTTNMLLAKQAHRFLKETYARTMARDTGWLPARDSATA